MPFSVLDKEASALAELLTFCTSEEPHALAHRLLSTFGSLFRVLSADLTDLLAIDGMDERSAICLQLVFVSHRFSAEQQPPRSFHKDDEPAIADFLFRLFLGDTTEQVRFLCFDKGGSYLGLIPMTRGSRTRVQFQIPELLQLCRASGAHSVIMAHNHPDGTATPSADDRLTSQQVYDALRSIHVFLHAHYIIAKNTYALCPLVEDPTDASANTDPK